MLLNFCGWDLNFATPLHFIETIVNGETTFFRCIQGLEYNLCEKFKRRVLGLADLVLGRAEFNFYKSSKVAVACLATARFEFGLEPIWPTSMEVMTGYTYVDLKREIEHLSLTSQLAEITTGTVNQPFFDYEHYAEPLKTETKCKNKALPTSYNSARNKRRPLLSKQGSKTKMYYRQV